MTTVPCGCGATVELDGPTEVEHYVWAIRRDGTRSNLGNCPVQSGWVEAIVKTSHVFGINPVEYRGQRVGLNTPIPEHLRRVNEVQGLRLARDQGQRSHHLPQR